MKERSSCKMFFFDKVRLRHLIFLLFNNLFLEATSSSILKICRIDKIHSSCWGSETVFLLCDKVQKGSYMFRFVNSV